MEKVIIDVERCKGCGLCESVCPKKVIKIDKNSLNSKGYHPACADDQSDCISCAMCGMICPDVAIKIQK